MPLEDDMAAAALTQKRLREESKGAFEKKGAAKQHKVVQPLEKSQTGQPAGSNAGKSLA
jgi:hypothetical protein